jgi:hypothetical protein
VADNDHVDVHLFFTADVVSMMFVMVAVHSSSRLKVDSPHDGGCVLFCLGEVEVA